MTLKYRRFRRDNAIPSVRKHHLHFRTYRTRTQKFEDQYLKFLKRNCLILKCYCVVRSNLAQIFFAPCRSLQGCHICILFKSFDCGLPLWLMFVFRFQSVIHFYINFIMVAADDNRFNLTSRCNLVNDDLESSLKIIKPINLLNALSRTIRNMHNFRSNLYAYTHEYVRIQVTFVRLPLYDDVVVELSCDAHVGTPSSSCSRKVEIS